MLRVQIASEQRLRLACKWLVFSLGPAAVKDTQSLSFLAWKRSLSRGQEWIQHAPKKKKKKSETGSDTLEPLGGSLSRWSHGRPRPVEPGEARKPGLCEPLIRQTQLTAAIVGRLLET